MKIKLGKLTLLTTVIISSLFLTSCGKVSVYYPAINKLTLKAQQYMQESDVEEAIVRLRVINDLDPNIAENYYNLGVAYYKTEDYEKAIDSLNTAIKLDEKLKNAYYSLAVIQEDLAQTYEKEIGNIKKEKDKEKSLTEINDLYVKAKENYEKYAAFDIPEKEQNSIKEKIEEFENKIEKKDEEAGEDSKED